MKKVILVFELIMTDEQFNNHEDVQELLTEEGIKEANDDVQDEVEDGSAMSARVYMDVEDFESIADKIPDLP